MFWPQMNQVNVFLQRFPLKVLCSIRRFLFAGHPLCFLIIFVSSTAEDTKDSTALDDLEGVLSVLDLLGFPCALSPSSLKM